MSSYDYQSYLLFIVLVILAINTDDNDFDYLTRNEAFFRLLKCDAQMYTHPDQLPKTKLLNKETVSGICV